MLRIVKSKLRKLTGPLPHLKYSGLQKRETLTGARTRALEWAVTIVMVLLCVTLTALQYRWTGQISRAEGSRLQSIVREGLHAVCQAFDSSLTQSVRDLRPDAEEIDLEGFESAHLQLYESWIRSRPPRIFKRIAYVVPTRDNLNLFLVEQREKRVLTSDWPADWEPLQRNLASKLGGPKGSGPFLDLAGLLFAFPLHGERMGETNFRGRGGPREEFGVG